VRKGAIVDTEHAVVIVGGGPTGLMLAAELALAGIDVVVVERRASQDLDGSRARGLHARTIEVLDQRGVADRFVSQGQTFPVAGFAHISLDISDLPSRHNYVLGLMQNRFEEILAGWVGELTVPIYRGNDVTGFTQDDNGVDIGMSDGERHRAQYLVGCDGGRSLIRKVAGVEFPGWDPTVSSVVAEVEMRDEPEVGIRHDDNGTQAIGPMQDGKRFGVVVSQPHAEHTAEPTLGDLRSRHSLRPRRGTSAARPPHARSRFRHRRSRRASLRTPPRREGRLAELRHAVGSRHVTVGGPGAGGGRRI